MNQINITDNDSMLNPYRLNNHHQNKTENIVENSKMDQATPVEPNKVSSSSPPMPWFGMDIGGTLVKLVFFEPTDKGDDESESDTMETIRHYLKSNSAYGESGKRDVHLELSDCFINGRRGRLHFIRFPTSQMPAFIQLAKSKGIASMTKTVCATGGGAFKFETELREQMRLELHKYDEIDSVIHGVHFMEAYNPTECYYIRNANRPNEAEKVPYDFKRPFPFLVVNIGSGVSILAVYSPGKFQRIFGSSIGGGTFVGLTCLLTGCQTFEEAIELATQGDNKKVDKLVKDIYGGDYPKLGLSGDTIAASFGNMILPEKREKATPADLARSVLVTITNNIGSIAFMCANEKKIERVVFIGNFLRVNQFSTTFLASALDFWSSGKLKAVFLEHEGYFGAVGCLLQLMNTENEPSPPQSPNK